MGKSINKFAVILLVLISVFLFSNYAFCQQSPLIKSGVEQYREENYEEAIEIFQEAREKDPKSSVAAFYLGMAYKQTMDYEKSFENLKDAATLTPRIKESLVELVDVATQLGDLEEAKKWVEVGERENISPAKIAFLKGLILKEEGKNSEAAEAFQKAKQIDPKVSQAADIQIALGFYRESEYEKAKKSFESAITYNPESSLADFARQYLASVEQRIESKKSLRYTYSLFVQYDDNMVLKPNDELYAAGITNEGSMVANTAFRVNYAPVFEGPWLFNARYGLTSSLHDKNKNSHDSFSNSISITPGYSFGKYALSLAISYNHTHVRKPDYKQYSGTFSSGPLLRRAFGNNQLIEFFAGYINTEYHQIALDPNENRDSNGLSSYISWIWLFGRNSFLNIRYQYSDQDAEGENWDNARNALSLNMAFPVSKNTKFQLSAQASDQNFDNTHTTFGIAREDTMYSFSGGLSWNWKRYSTIVFQYSHVSTDSNLGIYDYTRNMYTMGLEFRF
ncbi:tetratricopeptide repeat protein [Thermodesulfobacteriota bacterium]